ncbi:hypothetical protein GLOIN_2v1834676 [Rhizophagus clarus]|uniref:Uncharacterized protein n=1 Tax=Rhizophagus clarus TaxID=94130 RepID=A0A8H3QIS8_9GLOM|nr:hypothetical protein GLOIN_2v1834676 [Rhizophagus clarus]
MVVDCGGGTVDLTTRKLFKHSKIIERTGDFVVDLTSTENLLNFLVEIQSGLNLSNLICPVLKQYCNDHIEEEMEENDWIIDINFEDLKSMQPIAAIVRGACDYGIEMSTIVDRTLKYTYGVKIKRDSTKSKSVRR